MNRDLFFSSAIGTAAAFAGEPPNIILILADDMGFESISAYGCESYKTPRIDKMAEDGILFSWCFSQPLSTPSRVQMMTGKYNNRNYTEFGELRAGETTFANLLRDAGYVTAIAGKWQLGGNAQVIHDFGFDQFCLWQMDGERGSRYRNPKINRDGEWLTNLNDAYGPDIFSDYVCDFMKENKDRPFFIYYPEVLPHSPFEPTPDDPEWGRKANERFYASMVAYLDKVVGKVIDAANQLPADRETWIFFTGDNGTNKQIKNTVCNGKIMPGGKGLTTDAGTHVPLIIYRTGGAAAGGKVCNDLIDFSDFLPTLCDISGARIPEHLQLDGRSFLPQLNRQKGNPREWIYVHYNPRFGKVVPSRFARNHEWKLYADGRFFNMMDDREEINPLLPEYIEQNNDMRTAKQMLEAVINSMPSEF